MFSEKNKTIRIENLDVEKLQKQLLYENDLKDNCSYLNKTICWESLNVLQKLPSNSVDLVVTDPPYNLTKNYAWNIFKSIDDATYEKWVDTWMEELKRVLKPNGSLYVCCDWKSSASICQSMKKHFKLLNRITWEREKWRWAKNNWKNCIEDIYFWVMNEDNYTFNLDAVKIKKKVIAPYINNNWEAKDWFVEKGQNYRLTSPSNVWTDISIPFWSMPENTTHPTQKPEKLIAKIILASSNPWDFVLDPFLWSWTTSVVAKKLNRNYLWIEREKEYALIAEHRLNLANLNKSIQGYKHGIFWERNSSPWGQSET